MPRKSLPKICFDRLLADDQIIQAARQAIEENPANIPLLETPADGFGAIEPLATDPAHVAGGVLDADDVGQLR